MRCKLCHNQNLSAHNSIKEKSGCDFYHCPECDLIFLAEKYLPDPEAERERYLEHNNTFDCSGYVDMMQEFIDSFLQPFLPGIDRALDFGCGPGPVLASLLAEKLSEVDIYDPYFFPEEDFREHRYGLITSTEVWEHLFNPAYEISLLCGLLKDGGYLAVMTSLHPGVDKFTDWHYHLDRTHVTFFSWKTIKWISRRFPLQVAISDREKRIVWHKE